MELQELEMKDKTSSAVYIYMSVDSQILADVWSFPWCSFIDKMNGKQRYCPVILPSLSSPYILTSSTPL